jgi:DNA-binding MarR family transcriptional regulator
VTESPAADRSVDVENRITLGLLNAVHEDNHVSQRKLATELGIALGLTNAYLKRCIRKGLVKVSQVPANRYAYYLTPKGFAEKSRLTAGYLRRSFDFYRQARSECDALLGTAAAKDWRHVALGGIGELAEIAVLCGVTHAVELIGVIDARTPVDSFFNLPVVPSIVALPNVDAVLVTDVRNPQGTYNALRATLAPQRILTPGMLRISRESTSSGDAVR